MPFVRVRVGGAETTADADGVFMVPGRFATGLIDIRVIYDSKVRSHGASSRLRVMDEQFDARSETRRVVARTRGGKNTLGAVALASVDCEIWRLAAAVLDDYHKAVGTSPPAGELRIKRWSEVWDGRPCTYYDYMIFTADWGTTGAYRDERRRRESMFHELGHSIRHVADGSEAHWSQDSIRWAYSRKHWGCETYNTQYAFNEGWAGYWEYERAGGMYSECRKPEVFMDWTEAMIARELERLARALSSDASVRTRKMVAVLERHPHEIHSLRDFEVKYCNLYWRGNGKCKGKGEPARARPGSCPPGYHDDGATCRLIDIVAKPSYRRGMRVSPRGCVSGQESVAGLCYDECRAGYRGMGPMCWGTCPEGFADHGATCYKPPEILVKH